MVEMLVKALEEEKMAENAAVMGERLMKGLKKLPSDVVELVRGRGLMCAIIIKDKFDAMDVCLRLRDHGLIAKPTHGTIIRFTPPCIMKADEMDECLDIIHKTIATYN